VRPALSFKRAGACQMLCTCTLHSWIMSDFACIVASRRKREREREIERERETETERNAKTRVCTWESRTVDMQDDGKLKQRLAIEEHNFKMKQQAY